VVFLQGVLANCGGRSWYFCGDFVVRCVVKDGGLMVPFHARKILHYFELFFAD
jgi:hypothetical protein